ncbi:hypothetical protein BAUCODRAFT_451592 [Baudoinia panamericana UAMH 10762]|uniref:Uncharacterized protein n=1 Tax=Baudoinia panamericana (strain UAMH 10762) TaxID=717646 RepID=M2LSG0_BAUPA|nr:uncharacterized protein BAUCODRAFT_451592 [Baudoinia panamericana UAMH 10762]EMC97412.1 hypothetical protein BAUCODRAFT_451592 [Baudoinia panamericana UAMH 10762]
MITFNDIASRQQRRSDLPFPLHGPPTLYTSNHTHLFTQHDDRSATQKQADYIGTSHVAFEGSACTSRQTDCKQTKGTPTCKLHGARTLWPHLPPFHALRDDYPHLYLAQRHALQRLHTHRKTLHASAGFRYRKRAARLDGVTTRGDIAEMR